MNTRERRGLLELVGKLAASAILTVLLLVAIDFAVGLVVRQHDDSGSSDAVDRRRAIKGDTVSTTLAYLGMNPTPLREDPTLLWVNQENASRTQFINPRAFGSMAKWTTEINSQGFRGPEVRQDRSIDKTYRILCVGDSVTFGFNADQEETYPAQLGTILKSNHPDMDIEVINAGVPGWSWLQGLRFLERQGLAFEPDLTIMAHGINDQVMPAVITDAERFRDTENPHALWSATIRSWAARTNTYRLAQARFGAVPKPIAHAPDRPSPGCQEQIEAYGDCKRVSPEQIEDAITMAGQLAESNHFDLLVLNLDFPKTRATTAAKRATRAKGIAFVDVVRRMDSLRTKTQRQRSDDLGLLPGSSEASRRVGNSPNQRRRVTFRVQSPNAATDYSARGFDLHSKAFAFNTPLNDLGRDGDENSNDGVYSGTLTLPPDVGTLRFVFYSGENREFQPLPPSPSTLGDRMLQVHGNLRTPVFRFAERFMMAELIHPNAEGYAAIAKIVARKILNQPSFIRRQVGRAHKTAAALD